MSRSGIQLVRKLKLHHLRVIVAVRDKGSLLQAASILGVTQPALTRSLHEVEMIIGHRLFTRHSRGVTANKLGELLADSALQVFARLEQLGNDIDQQLSVVNPVVRVGVLPAVARGLLPGAMLRLQQAHPHVHLRVIQAQTTELLAELSSGALDLVIGRLYASLQQQQFDCTELYQDHVAVLARADHPLFAEQQLIIDKLADYPLMLTNATAHAAMEVEELLEKLPLAATAQFETNSSSLLRELLLCTDNIALLPRLVMLSDIKRGTLREVVALPIARPQGLIVRRGERLSQDASCLIDALREEITQLQAYV